MRHLYHRVCLMLVWTAAGLTGCATTQCTVSVDALVAQDGSTARCYWLVPGNENTEADDLQFQEYAAYLHGALASQGFQIAASLEAADLAVIAVYGISEPDAQTFTYALPQWGQTGVGSSTTYGSFNTYGNTGSYSATTYYQPTYGITGYTTGVGRRVVYTRILALAGVDANSVRQGGDAKELWRVSAVSVGSSGDLRHLFPYLVAAAKPHIGKATPAGAVEVHFSENSPEVVEVRGALAPAQPRGE